MTEYDPTEGLGDEVERYLERREKYPDPQIPRSSTDESETWPGDPSG